MFLMPLVCIRVNEAPMRRSSSMRAATAFACLSSRSMGFFAACRIWLDCPSEVSGKSLDRHIRFLNVTEPGSLDFDIALRFHSNRPYLCAYMLPFTIAVGPNIQCFAVASLLLYVVCYCFFVFLNGMSKSSSTSRRDQWNSHRHILLSALQTARRDCSYPNCDTCHQIPS